MTDRLEQIDQEISEIEFEILALQQTREELEFEATSLEEGV